MCGRMWGEQYIESAGYVVVVYVAVYVVAV